jgi:hypothetical protein
MNKLGIPNKGVNFCCHCYEFHEHFVVVDESNREYVKVTLTCTECEQVHIVTDPKNTFYEYEEVV